MTEILNQNELDALLTAISTGEVQSSECQEPAVRKVRAYDFRRPDKFAKDHIRTLRMMHETFSRLTAAMLSARLRAPVSVNLVSTDQLLYGEFIRSVADPTTMAIMELYPLNGAVVFEMGPGLTFSVIDRLFGGHGEPRDISRELTDIELYAMDRLFTGITGNIMVTWSNVISLKPVLACLETNPQFAQIVPPKDIVLLLTFEVKIGDTEGILNFCMPYITLEPVIDRLSAKYWYSSDDGERKDRVADRLDRAEFMRHIIFRDAVDPLSPEAIRKLKPGTVIPLKKGSRALPLYEFFRAGKEA